MQKISSVMTNLSEWLSIKSVSLLVFVLEKIRMFSVKVNLYEYPRVYYRSGSTYTVYILAYKPTPKTHFSIMISWKCVGECIRQRSDENV